MSNSQKITYPSRFKKIEDRHQTQRVEVMFFSVGCVKLVLPDD